jgi:2-polyprenyl-3-methyl-5-hydroxy-6-metoxy-1,4-benzoquinol methylase
MTSATRKNLANQSMVSAEQLEAGWQKLGKMYPAESWFRDVHLAENKGRIFRIIRDVIDRVPAAPGNELVDVGCFNGFLCQLFHYFGYSVTGIDALADRDVPERAELLRGIDAKFYFANFNNLDPFPECPKNHFSAAVLGEVFEHILNHPSGLLVRIFEILKPGGILILTTPNPFTLANSLRVLRGQGFVWGDTEFATMPKIAADGGIISYEGIHYREYSQSLLLNLVGRAGFEVVKAEYIGPTVHAKQPWLNRAIKSSPVWSLLERTRLFGSGNYLVCRRPA